MKKFKEEIIKNDGMCFAVHKNGKTTYEIQGLTSSPLIIFGDWVSPEDYQAEIDERKRQYEKHQEIYFKTAKKLNEAELELSKLKSQLEKQQPDIPEVPQFVADWYEKNKDNLEFAVFSINIDTFRSKFGDRSNIENWFSGMKNKPIETIFSMKNGYTVGKPKIIVSPCPVCGFEDVENNFCGVCGHENEYVTADEVEE